MSNGNPSFGHAACKNFSFRLTKEICHPISQCCKHPCTLYIWNPPQGGRYKSKPELDADLYDKEKQIIAYGGKVVSIAVDPR